MKAIQLLKVGQWSYWKDFSGPYIKCYYSYWKYEDFISEMGRWLISATLTLRLSAVRSRFTPWNMVNTC